MSLAGERLKESLLKTCCAVWFCSIEEHSSKNANVRISSRSFGPVESGFIRLLFSVLFNIYSNESGSYITKSDFHKFILTIESTTIDSDAIAALFCKVCFVSRIE